MEAFTTEARRARRSWGPSCSLCVRCGSFSSTEEVARQHRAWPVIFTLRLEPRRAMPARLTMSLLFAVIAVACAAQTAPQEKTSSAAPQHLAATPQAVAWGYYDAAAAPVLRIKSG